MHIGVATLDAMALLTDSITMKLHLQSITSQEIHMMGDKLQMIAPNTGAVLAQVIGLKTVSDRPHLKFVANTVSIILLPPSCADTTIALAVAAAHPYPALPKFRAMYGYRSILVDLFPKPILK